MWLPTAVGPFFIPSTEDAMNPFKASAVLFSLFLGAQGLRAEEAFPSLQVVPWNGHKAAVSLTFDDGDPIHLDLAVPELNQRHMHGTFFLIANRIDRKDDWRKILKWGHEIGNHTLDHLHPATLTPDQEEAQVEGAKNVLQKEFGIRIYSFAYPFTEITPGLRKWVEKDHLLARGGYGATYDLKPDSEPDWANIPSRTTLTSLPFSTYQSWIDDDWKDGAWLVWMIHGLEGTPWGWEPISKKNFEGILDAIQSKDIWAGTFLEVGSYFRAQKVFEKSQVRSSAADETWTWKVPDLFPPDVTLKLRVDPTQKIDGKTFEIRQGSETIPKDANGFYPIDFNKGTLTVSLMPKR